MRAGKLFAVKLVTLLATITTCLLALVATPVAYGNDKPVLRASVSPEFPQGLQYKQLQFIARELGAVLAITPMPPIRRIAALKRNDIDIMVAVKASYETEGKFSLLMPSYEQIETAMFVRRGQDLSLLHTPEFVLGLSVDDHYTLVEQIFPQAGLVKVNTLKQKISLLMNNRVDGFLHLRQGAQARVDGMGLGEQLMAVPVPDLQTVKYYIGISNESPFFHRKAELEQIITRAVKQGEFAKLRQDHYAKLHRK